MVVGVVLLFHLLTLQSLYHVLRRRRPVRRGLLWMWGGIGIVLLDLPLIYLQLIYKSWHPLWADHFMNVISIPWALLQVNLLVVGGLLLTNRFFYRPLKHMVGRRTKNSTEVPIPSTYSEVTEPATSSQMPRRRFIQSSAIALGGLAANVSMLSAANTDEDSRIERIKIRIPGLPEELKGTTIGMISDVHSSLFMNRDRMERYATTLQSLKADLIVLPGDFVNSRSREVYPFAEAFSRLSAPLGVYGVTGNHDYYTREIEIVAKGIEEAGIKLLRNENIRIEKNGKSFWLMGLDDRDIYEVNDYLKDGKTEKGIVENLVRGVRDDEPKILLCHKPYPFEEYATLGVDLMLSGHTHGGQIVLGRLDRLNVSVASLASTYISGLYKAHANHNAQMYVSRGIGTAGIPLRVNCPPEVTHIMLV
ncbi:MAG: metallophosphoesterase [Candidatus Kapaibacterium sp.]